MNNIQILNRIDQLLQNTQGFHRELSILRKQVEQQQPQMPQAQAAPPRTTVTPPPPPAVAQKATPTPAIQKPVAQAAPPYKQPARPPAYKSAPAKPRKPFFERFPQLEKLLGEKLIPFIGIIVLVTGIGFFVSYAIDKGWINEIGRTSIGILAGGALAAVAHFMRKSYRTFSSILLGGGIATMYFTIFYAYSVYGIFSQGSAFAVMCSITLFSSVAAIYYNRQEIAILGMVGGFASPIMVSNDGGDYIVLFSYMLILNAGMAALAWFKDWKVLNVLGFGFTLFLVTGRVLTLDPENYPTIGLLAFGTAFFVLFFVQNIAYNMTRGKKFGALDYTLLILNNAAFYALGMYLLADFNNGIYQGIFTVAMGVFNFGFTALLYKRRQLDKNLIYALIGLVLTFLTSAVPIQLDGNHITLFWAAEMVLLLWLSQRTKLNVLRSASVLVAFCMLGSLILTWGGHFKLLAWSGYSEAPILPILVNKLFVTTIASLAALFAYNFLLRKENEAEAVIGVFGLELTTVKQFRAVFPFITALFVYLGGLLEVRYQICSRSSVESFQTLGTVLYHFVFAAGLYVYLNWFKNKLIQGMALVMNIGTTLLFLFLTPLVFNGLRDKAMLNEIPMGMFSIQFIAVILAAFLLWQLVRQFKAKAGDSSYQTVLYWFIGIVSTTLLCMQLDHLFVMILSPEANGIADMAGIKHAVQLSHKVGYPLVWGTVAFSFIVLGLKRSKLHMRIFGLALLGLTLLKIFAIDVWQMNELGRIIAFISLGILILVIAFLYQRIAKLLFTDESASEAPEAQQATS